MKNKIIIIGVDGADLDNFGNWIKDGTFPFMKSLADKGVMVPLKSTMPPSSCPAWVSFGTGKNPGKYGTFSFMDKKYKSYECSINYNTLNEVKGFWDYLNDYGHKTILIDIPLFAAAKKLNGCFVGGEFCKKAYFYPKELENEKDFKNQKLGEKRIVLQWPIGTPKETIIKNIFEMLENRIDITEYLLKKKEWDVLVSIFQYDTLGHFAWNNISKRIEYGKKLDKFLADLLKDEQNVNVFIMGDHGHGELKGRFHINNWLIQNGYLKLKKSKRPKVSFAISRYVPKEKIEKILTKMGLARVVMNIVPESIRKRWSGANIKFEDLNIDWSKTRAFACGDVYTGSIYINKKGREPKGIVTDTKSLISEIKHKLKQLKGPNGEHLKISPFESSELYHGEYAKCAPDIIYTINDVEYTTDFTLNAKNLLFSKTFKEGDHRPEGMFIASGPDIKKDAVLKKMDIMDIAPTVLAMAGIPVPLDIDGRVLKEMLNKNELVDKSKIEKERISKAISKIKF